LKIEGQFLALHDRLKSSIEVPMKFVVNPIESLESRTLLSAGQLDPTFSGDGRIADALPFRATVGGSVAQSDGKIIIAGTRTDNSTTSVFVARLTTSGALDTSFSGDGIASASFAGALPGRSDVAIDSQGRIVVIDASNDKIFAARFSSNGTLDGNFNVSLDSGGPVEHNFIFPSVAVQNDDKVLIAYGTRISRLGTTGSLDSTFGNGGTASVGMGIFDIALGPDGKIVAAGETSSAGKTSWDALARLNTDGSPDTTFTDDPAMDDGADGPPGMAIFGIAHSFDDNGLTAVTVGPDSSIYVAGYTSTSPSVFTAAKFASTGVLQWDDDGEADPYRTSWGTTVALDSDGKLVVGVDAHPLIGAFDNFGDFALVRYNVDGTRDTAFGDSGTARTDFTDFTQHTSPDDYAWTTSADTVRSIIITGDKYIAVSGFNEFSQNQDMPVSIARYDGGDTPSISPVSVLSDGAIQIVGTNASEQIEIYNYDGWKSHAYGAANVNGAVWLTRADQSKVKINSYDGNDFIRVLDGTTARASIDGGAGNDTIYSFAGESTLYGGDGNDYLSAWREGSENVSTMYGGIGVDTLNGADGDDFLYAEGGNDVIYANGGDDRAEGGGGNDFVYGMGGDDYVIGSSGNDRVEGGAGDDRMEGQSGDDSLYGNAGRDALFGGSSNDLLDGGSGADYMQGDDGNDTITYAARSNAVTVGLGTSADDGEVGEGDNARDDIENIIGGAGNDDLRGSAADNQIYGLGGNDLIYAHGGNDFAAGGAGNDTVYGEGGNDDITGNDGADRLDGGSGDDQIDGGTGADQIFGQSGNDIIFAKDGVKDLLNGGSGTDSAQRDNSASVKDDVLSIETFIA
jgi:uncharacterized delta-60 repeat protein